MAGFASSMANSTLLLFLQGVAIANLADNAATSPITNVYLSLHTATPAAGNQSTSEAAYTSYARQALIRSTSTPGFTVATNVATLSASTSFPASTGSPSETETFAGVGKSVSGANQLYFYGALSPTIAVTAAGITPQILNSSTITLT
jgi:hypothetical protein